jgi:hypothetical protein
MRLHNQSDLTQIASEEEGNFMMNRRRALLLMGAAIGGAGQAGASAAPFVCTSLSGNAAALPNAPSDSSGGTNGAIDARLRKDLERIESRVNSDAGVPVFLCCVNLAVNNTLQKPPAPALTELNAKLAAEFRQTAAAWERIRPNPDASDVAHVIEVLAYRDFSPAGTGQM